MDLAPRVHLADLQLTGRHDHRRYTLPASRVKPRNEGNLEVKLGNQAENGLPKGSGGVKSDAKPETLERVLWDAAVKLRGNVAPADYKHFVLPLIFLRYCSLRFEERREEIRKEVRESQTKYGSDQLEMFLNSPDEYRSKNIFIVPPEASWSFLVKSAQRDDIKTVVDNALVRMQEENPKLKDVLRRVYAGSNLDAENLRGLLSLFSREMFSQRTDRALDMLGKTYEYFIGNFANTEGARGGEYFTPESVVRILVECMQPRSGVVFDPACGSGGMFVQSDRFSGHRRDLAFYGQERIDTTLRLSKLNLFMHELDGDIRLGDSLLNDQFPDLKADFVIANPPFNLKQWGADKLDKNDGRLTVDGKRVSVPDGNANYMWMLHYLFHLKEGGTAGTVMANGSMTTSTKEEYELRKAFLEAGLVDCVIQLPGQLFSQTGIPVCLWIFRKRTAGTKDVFFIDARKLGKLKPGSRKQKELNDDEIERIANAYQAFRNAHPEELTANAELFSDPGFCAVASLDDIRKSDFKLTPGIFVGSTASEEDDEAFDEKFGRLTNELMEQFAASSALQERIKANLASVSTGGTQ